MHIQALDEDLAKSLGLDEDKGALVAEVTPDSPAASAGFKQGDVILSYGGQQIEQLRDLTSAVADTKAGADVDVVVWRDGGEKTLEVEIGQMPGEEQMAALTGDEQPQDERYAQARRDARPAHPRGAAAVRAARATSRAWW